MTNKNDPLDVLLAIKKELKLNVDEELIKECYQIQTEHQYDKDRDTLKLIRSAVETKVKAQDGSTLL